MLAISQSLVQKLQQLPPQRLAEVEDFVGFLMTQEMRIQASSELQNTLARLDTLNLPNLSEDEIDAEIKISRQNKTAKSRQ